MVRDNEDKTECENGNAYDSHIIFCIIQILSFHLDFSE